MKTVKKIMISVVTIGILVLIYFISGKLAEKTVRKGLSMWAALDAEEENADEEETRPHNYYDDPEDEFSN